MASSLIRTRTRITAANTWTEVCGATKGLAAGFEGLIDIAIANWATANATVLVAITDTSTAPSADTAADWTRVLNPAPTAPTSSGYECYLEGLLLRDGNHLWVKSNQTDTRVAVAGTFKAVP